jgi:uncharacterized spore protein YtfJ
MDEQIKKVGVRWAQLTLFSERQFFVVQTTNTSIIKRARETTNNKNKNKNNNNNNNAKKYARGEPVVVRRQ